MIWGEGFFFNRGIFVGDSDEIKGGLERLKGKSHGSLNEMGKRWMKKEGGCSDVGMQVFDEGLENMGEELEWKFVDGNVDGRLVLTS